MDYQNPFDTEVNEGLMASRDPISNAVATLFGGSVASIVDIGASIWNTLPGTDEVETQELLERIGGDPLRVYEEHPDAINAASLIGGSFVGGGIALKGMQLARNGVKGANWFSTAGQTARRDELAGMLSRGQQETAAYKNLLWNNRGIAAGNALADTVAAEAAMLVTMGAHPYLEDYWEDPVKNVGLSLLIGGGLGTVGGLMVDRAAVKGQLGAIMNDALTEVGTAIRPISGGMAASTAFQENAISIENLGRILQNGQKAGKTAETDLVMQIAQKYQRDLESNNTQLFDSILAPELRDLPVNEKAFLREAVRNNANFHGVEKIRVINAKEVMTNAKVNANLVDEPVLRTQVLNKATGQMQDEGVTAVYFSDIGKFGTTKDVQHHAGAAILDLSPEQAAKRIHDSRSYAPNSDASFELLAKPTPYVEADYVSWKLKFAKMSDEDFAKHVGKSLLASDDIPQLEALAQRMAGNPAFSALKIKIADRAEEAQAILGAEKRTMGGTPVKYQEAAERTLNNQTIAKYELAGNRAISNWIGGDQFAMQKSATSYFAKGFNKSSRSAEDAADAKTVQEIYESSKSQMLRADITANMADKDGMVYLFRGTHAPKIFGQAPLESMAITTSKASQFGGKTHLYKIHVDDIVAAWKDIGPSGDNVEILVRASAREAEATLTGAGKIEYNKALQGNLKQAQSKAYQADPSELLGYVKEGKFKQLSAMLQKGYPIDVIAKRVSMPTKTVEAFLASDRTFETFEYIQDLFRFGSAEQAAEALAIKNRPLLVSGSLRKADYTKGHANLNAASLQQINQMWASTAMMQSSSPMVRSMAETVFERFSDALSIARSKLGMVNTELMGSAAFTSTDHAMRHMGDIAPIFNVIGKDITHLANATSKRLLEPLSDMMDKIKVDDVVTLTELNVAHNMMASTKGYRIYKDRQFWVPEEALDASGKTVTVMKPLKFRDAEFKVKSDLTDSILLQADNVGKELYQMEETRRAILGQASNNNIGFWMPAVNPVNKHVAYLHDPVKDVTRMVYGRTKEELEAGLKVIATTEQTANPNLLIVRKGDQQWWSYTNGRADTINMTAADAGQLKTGSAASALVPVGRDVLSEIVSGYEHFINASARNLADVAMSDITDSLRRYSSYVSSDFDAQPLGMLARIKQKPKDAGKAALNVLLGNPMLGEYEGWQTLSSGFEIALSKAADVTRSIWHGMKKVTPGKDMSKFDFVEYEKKLADAGVVNPFRSIEEYTVAQGKSNPEISKRIVSATNGMTATMALRFGELAHPIVNLMSMPILTALSNGKHLPANFMGAIKQTANVPTSQIMFEGVRAMNSPRFAALNKKWEELGYFTPMVSEATKTLAASRKFEKGAMAGLEKAVESNFVTMMSKPADWSEAVSRKITMNTGYQLGKRLYPELDDNALTIFARDFMDKSLGNYSAAQRPVMFQGTLGMALGLFQTYMLTLAQAMYRNVEIADWKTLGKGMLAQSTIFGYSSLPGFQPISEMIGNQFSDEHFDLTTGTYRALGDDAANWVLYGLPSNLAQSAAYTRGDIEPRVPNILAGAQNMVGVNMAMQAAGTVKNMAGAMGEGASAGQAMLQALSLQNLSRPIARNAEWVMAATGEGGALNQAGRTVQNSAEVFTINGIASRVFSMRPLEEAKLREMQHMNRFYEAADKERRTATINSLRTAFRAGTNTPEKVAEIAAEYMRNGGSPAGWRTAYRNAQATTNASGTETFADELDDDSPLQVMMSSLD